MICTWLDAHGSSCLEAAGFLSGALNVWLTTKEKIWSWPIGILNAAVYALVFGRAGLYSDTGLQVFYLLLSVYGWYAWLHGGERGGTLSVTRTPRRMWMMLTGAWLAGWALLWLITHRIPGAALPVVDAALVSTSLVAMFMQTRKLRECWIVWNAANIGYIVMFFQRDLVLTSVLYLVFFMLAIHGYREWNRSLERTSHASS